MPSLPILLALESRAKMLIPKVPSLLGELIISEYIGHACPVLDATWKRSMYAPSPPRRVKSLGK